MKIAFVSDTHLEFRPQPLPPLPEDVDVLVLAGDINTGDGAVAWALETFSDKVRHIIYVAGNHEGYGYEIKSVYRRLREITADLPNFHFLERDVITIDGICFIGATTWTNYEVGNAGAPALNMVYAQQGLNDFRRIGWEEPDGTRFVVPEDFLKENELAKEFIFSELANQNRKNCVVVTHHGPTERSISPRFINHHLNCCYVNNWSDDIRVNGPALWFHGHVHDEFDYDVGDTRVLCNPLAYPGERQTPFAWRTVDISSTS